MNYKEILNELTLDEKIKLTSGISNWDFFGVNRLSLRAITVADGPHGVRIHKKIKESNEIFGKENLEKSTMFPSAVAMASTFNPELIFKVGETIGKECNMFGVDILLAPGVNGKRSPLGGRNFEYYSEDPFLTGEIASAFINGVQSTGVGACVKHFALNEQETQRRFVNTILDERTLHEFYLAPFETAIKKANPFTIMSSYNRVLGDYAGESSYLLKEILREKWGYTGVVMSDWGGVQNKVKSLKNGMNLEMPGTSEFEEIVKLAIDNEELSIKELDDSLLPLLHLYERIEKNTNKGKITSLEDNHLVAREVARQGIVLLENDGILPLVNAQNIAIVGDFAQNPRINGGGSASLNPFINETPIEEFKKMYNVSFTEGYIEENTNDSMLSKIKETVLDKDCVIFFTGSPISYDSEGYDRKDMKLPKDHIKVFQEILKYNQKIIVVLNNGSALDLSPITASNAIIEAWFLGGANAHALVEIILGKVIPSGRLSETIPLNIESTPFYRNFPSLDDDVLYYGDIMNVGYRFYDTHNYPVRYPFGYGLSYTNFEYSNLVLSSKVITNNESLEVKVSVKNTGEYDGYETVQLYINDSETYYARPKKELKGFKKVFIKKGETVDVTINLSERDFAVYAVDFKEFRVEAGEFKILVGSNVRDIQLSETISFKTENLIRRELTMDHPYNNWEKYQAEKVLYLEQKYRKIAWYEKEEPISRVLRRLKRQYNINENDYLEILKKLK